MLLSQGSHQDIFREYKRRSRAHSILPVYNSPDTMRLFYDKNNSNFKYKRGKTHQNLKIYVSNLFYMIHLEFSFLRIVKLLKAGSYLAKVKQRTY